MVCSPQVRLEEVEAFACLAVATIVTAGRLATAAMPMLPIKNLRRDVEVSRIVLTPIFIFAPLGVFFNEGGPSSPAALLVAAMQRRMMNLRRSLRHTT